MQSIITNTVVDSPNKYRQLRYKPSILYYLRIVFHNGTIVYKLGYTTTSLQERIFGKLPSYYWSNGKRVHTSGHVGMGIPDGTDVYVIAAYQHPNASYIYQVEQILHNKYKNDMYKGINLLANGNTELYTTDILNLDN